LDDIAKDLQERETLAEIAEASFKSSTPTPDPAATPKVTFSSELDTDDPYPEYFNFAKTQSDMKLLLSTTLNSVGIDTSDLPGVRVDVQVEFPGGKSLSLEAEMDSGSKPTSGLPMHIVQQNPEIQALLRPNRTYATMANRTVAVCYGTVELPISITHDYTTYRANVVFTVLDMPGGVPLIGLYDICFFPLFCFAT